jgi:hypothetical protein
LLEEGFLTALLVDASGTPLYVLDGQLSPTGHLSGSLRTLEYATNPALFLPQLKVYGQATISSEGDGSFWASIYSPLEGAIPVHPFGHIEGLLLPGSMQRQAPAGAHQRRVRLGSEVGGGSSDERSAAEVSGSVVVVCPDEGSQGSAGLPAVSLSGQIGVGPVARFERERSLAPGVIVCPHAPLNPISASIAGATKVPGQIGAASHGVPPQGEGQVRARWLLFP